MIDMEDAMKEHNLEPLQAVNLALKWKQYKYQLSRYTRILQYKMLYTSKNISNF
jgi:hypothetical protein